MSSKHPARIRIVLDTSSCVAALLSSSGGSAKIFELILGGKIYNFFTEQTLEEVKRVLGRKKN